MADIRYKIVFRVHAVKRMFDRGIAEDEVIKALQGAETIAAYPDDTPYPSRLVLGYSGEKSLHLVVADNEDDKERIVVTVYEPDRDKWSEDLRTRLKR